MDKFRDVYREACRELPSPSMDAAKVRDDLRHHRRMRQRRRYLITRGCAAAAVFLYAAQGRRRQSIIGAALSNCQIPVLSLPVNRMSGSRRKIG